MIKVVQKNWRKIIFMTDIYLKKQIKIGEKIKK